MVLASFLVFASALVASLTVLARTLAPAMPRIVSILRGEGDPAWVERPMLVLSDRRLRARVRPVVLPSRPPVLRAVA